MDIAIPAFGYQNHISIDRGFGLIRKWAASDAAAYAGGGCARACSTRPTRQVGLGRHGYRSKNEKLHRQQGFASHVHRKKPKGKPMPEAVRRANNTKSKVRARVEHVFAEQKDRMHLFISTIGIARATIKIGMTNLVYNIKRLIFLTTAGRGQRTRGGDNKA